MGGKCTAGVAGAACDFYAGGHWAPAGMVLLNLFYLVKLVDVARTRVRVLSVRVRCVTSDKRLLKITVRTVIFF